MSRIKSITITYSCVQEGGQERSVTLAVEFNDEQRQESAERAAAAAAEPADEPLPEAGESLQAETPAPPPGKRPRTNKKSYTVEEKTEIAMMYAAGEDVSRIAEKFGREPKAILSQVGKMHVKRGHNPTDPEQADASKQGSVLEKPWYLKK